MSEYDSPWKEALDCYFELFLLFFFPHIHADIDWSRGYEFLDKELQKIAPASAVGRGVVDKLVRVWRKNGEEEWVLIHIEIQSQVEADFSLRIYRYNCRIFERYNQKVVSLVILGDDRPNWQPDSYSHDLWGCSIDFRYPAVKLLSYASSWQWLEAQENPFAVLVMAHLKSMETRDDPAARRTWKFRLVRGLYERGLSAEDVRRLFNFIDWMMNLPEDLEIQFQQELEQYEEEKHMPYVTSIERLARIEELLAGIEVSLRIKFRDAGLQLLPEIQEIRDYKKLKTILHAIEDVNTPEELRQLWTADNEETTNEE